jgi:predicted metalloprotease with PDZ domain
MRAATDGAKRVDDLIFQFIKGRDAAPDALAYWRGLLVEALGEQGGAEFDGMMSGAPLDLPNDVFGPCFAAEDRMLQNYTLGFRPYEDEDGATRVGPVTPGSPADSAGMKRYDVIANPEALDAAENGVEGATMTLDVVRDGEAMTLSFAPWSPPSPGKQWVRTGVPEDQCNL